jgi:hypothetical protein
VRSGEAGIEGAARRPELMRARRAMRKKIELRIDRLAVESFATGEGDGTRGTVIANGPCTCGASCACPTARYWCADMPYTIYSCDYTANASCVTA